MARPSAGSSQPSAPGGAALQLAEVFVGQEETVGVIDAQPGDGAGADQFEEKPVRLVEDFGQLHADSGEIVDVEESAGN